MIYFHPIGSIYITYILYTTDSPCQTRSLYIVTVMAFQKSPFDEVDDIRRSSQTLHSFGGRIPDYSKVCTYPLVVPNMAGNGKSPFSNRKNTSSSSVHFPLPAMLVYRRVIDYSPFTYMPD